MSEFSKKSFSRSEISQGDSGVTVKAVLDLVKHHKFYGDLSRIMGISKIEGDFINIPGAHKLLTTINAENNKFLKFDYPCGYDDLEFTFDPTDFKKFRIKFKDVENQEVKDLIGKDDFIVEPIYSSRSDFFEGNFKMDKYASTLIKQGYTDVVSRNLELIREIYKKHKPKPKLYRILKDKKGSFFLRGIISPQYNDYSNNITVFLALITLHQEMKSNGSKFLVDRCEYNESFIRMYFEKEGNRPVGDIGNMGYLIEVSNDEIKREALRFSGVSTIKFNVKNESESQIYLRPRDFSTSLSSVKHNVTPKTAIEELASFSSHIGNEKEMYDDVLKIINIKEHNQIRHLMLRKIENTKQGELKKFSKSLLDTLNQHVSNIYDLLLLFNKLDLIVEDIDAKEYLRYLVYDALIKKI